jgi:hypothetical protein
MKQVVNKNWIGIKITYKRVIGMSYHLKLIIYLIVSRCVANLLILDCYLIIVKKLLSRIIQIGNRKAIISRKTN